MIDLRFESEAVPVDTFQVLQFDGEEEISHLFRFELRLVSRDPEIDLASVLQNHAKLAITTQDKTRYVHGMLCEFEQGGEWHSGLYEYRAVLVPRLWMMTQSTQNQIFQKQTVPDIVESELASVAQKGKHPLVSAGLSADDYEIDVKPRTKYMSSGPEPEEREYFEREYVVQYKESDFNFISRLMEHEGIRYYFEHDGQREKIVITDMMATEQISAQNMAEFQANATAARYDDSVVHKLSRIQSQIPGSVLMTDHNYRSPDLPMQASGVVGQDGIGFVTEFGAHFKSPEEGVTLATIRAEEYRCRQNIYAGESNIASFACGHLCSLDRHFRSDYNQDYLLTKVTHHGSQDIESWGKVGSTSYHNEFSCIPATLTYRPQRLTPKPKLYGIMNGTIDSEQDLGGRADLDGQGRYKVKMPFDISGAGEGMGSRRIRMAQPYGGGGSGMSFPLVKGTEVIWTCIDGDIDRPIITGAVPNSLNPSVTTTDNANSNVIKTTSGITMGFHDGSGGGSGQGAAGADGSLASQQQNQSLNAAINIVKENRNIKKPKQRITSTLANEVVQQSVGKKNLNLQQQMMADEVDLSGNPSSSGDDVTNTNGKQWVIKVPNYADDSSNKDTYLRLGMNPPEANNISTEDLYQKDGWLDYTDGHHVSIVKGKRLDRTHGKKTNFWNNDAFSYGKANKFTYALGNTFRSSMGTSGTVKTGLSVATTLAANVEMKLGADFKFGYGRSYTFYKGPSIAVTKSKKFEVDEGFTIEVDPDDSGSLFRPGTENFMENSVPILGAALAVASSSVAVAVQVKADQKDAGSDMEDLNDMAVAHGISTWSAGALLSVCALRYAKKQAKIKDKPASVFDMKAESAVISVSGSKKGEDKAKSIFLLASADNDDTEPSFIDIDKNKKKGHVWIQAGGVDKSKIILKVGKSSIEMSDEGIAFRSPKFDFLGDDNKLFTQINNQGLHVDKGKMTAKENIESQGDITAKGEVAGASVNGGSSDLGGSSSPPKAVAPKAPAKKWPPVKTTEGVFRSGG